MCKSLPRFTLRARAVPGTLAGESRNGVGQNRSGLLSSPHACTPSTPQLSDPPATPAGVGTKPQCPSAHAGASALWGAACSRPYVYRTVKVNSGNMKERSLRVFRHEIHLTYCC